ncbi:MAG: peptidase S41 [Chitinophagaceae bacterium]|nr:peptidase S41 [Chitinophagaceae bacterium]
MGKKSILFFLCIAFLSITTAQIIPQFSQKEMREDMTLLKKIFEANHPSLYWYSTKQHIDSVFNTVYNSLPDTLNEIEFRKKIAYWISEIRCGHTSVRYSKKFTRRLSQVRYPLFPLSIKVWKDSMVVLANRYILDTTLTRGTIITGINNRTNKEVIDSIFHYISTDGFAINHKNQVLSNNFSDWYKWVFGIDSVFTIHYVDSTGKAGFVNIKPLRLTQPHRDSSIKKIPVLYPPVPSRTNPILSRRAQSLLAKRVLLIDSTNKTAVMRLTGFSGGHLKRFFRKSFRSLQQLAITDLVIDLRENGGGKVDNYIKLTKYITDHPFKVGDTVQAISRKFPYGQYIHPSWIYWIAMNIGGRKEKDGTIHYRRYEKHYFQPITKNHFNGHVYLLQGGYSFSAATMFISSLKGQKNVTVVGEETGGGWYGNSAMHVPEIKLPHSNLRVRLPMYRLVIDSTRMKGRGIMPDWEINPSSYAIKKGIDLKMSLIQSEIVSRKQR